MELNEFLKKTGNQIRKLRLEQGLTQENLDQGKYAIPVRTLQDIEAGKSNFTASSLLKLAKQLKVSPKDLIDV